VTGGRCERNGDERGRERQCLHVGFLRNGVLGNSATVGTNC
jgi:hypothetical protein